MVTLAEIAPKEKRRVIDLVEEAGLDISDWSNWSGGAADAGRNPRYCYQWAFSEPGVAVVLNLWHQHCKLDGDKIVQRNNFRRDIEIYRDLKNSTAVGRARKLDAAVMMAVEKRLPIRVVLLDGDMRDLGALDAEASSVSKRSLDPQFWTVRDYDAKTGQHVLVRGNAESSEFVDQFDLPPPPGGIPVRMPVSGMAFARDARVRAWVRERAAGHCEYCGCMGFKMSAGRIYLETHHIISLAVGGHDTVGNVIALCPNHHREAHYGEDPIAFRDALLAKLAAR